MGDLRRDRFLYMGNELLGSFLDRFGEWAECVQDLLLPLLREGDIVADAGANVGMHAIPFAKAVGSRGLVHVFEPKA